MFSSALPGRSRGTRGATILPKRVVEAQLGAAVSSYGADTQLWSANFRTSDGLGLEPSEEFLVLQCSWGSLGGRGLVTHVNKSTLAIYATDPHLLRWGHLACFVLLGPPMPGEPGRTFGPANLWVAEVEPLREFVLLRQRGTIDPADFGELLSVGAVRPLTEALRQWRDGMLKPRPTPRPIAREEYVPPWSWFFGAGLPTPIGLFAPR